MPQCLSTVYEGNEGEGDGDGARVGLGAEGLGKQAGWGELVREVQKVTAGCLPGARTGSDGMARGQSGSTFLL